ncbi:MAG TPA: DNRLRE domain-containing protein, partial [Pyrinomonadaceae bacterium]|nr:DNRLRE domain-containing protein [Pyrinomonadaceae bacterium]
SSTAQTDAAGFYSFAGAPAGYSYTLTPSKTNYSFNPSSASLPNLNGNGSTNFTATPAAATAQLAPLADAYVRGGTSAGINFGTATQLVSRLASSASNTYESYLTFDVGQQSTVSNVRLRLYGRLSSGTNLAVSVYSVADTTWTETGIKWSNKPAAGALLRTTTVVNSTAAFYEWDITNYVRGEINAGRTRISLVLRNTATTSNDATFNSRQATTNQPRLLVTTP